MGKKEDLEFKQKLKSNS